MRRRGFLSVSAPALALTLVITAGVHSASLSRLPKSGEMARISVTDVVRTQELQNVLSRSRLSTAARDQAVAEFAKLPVDAQDAALAAISPSYTSQQVYTPAHEFYKFPDVDARLIFTPAITSMSPRGSAGTWIVVYGTGFNSDCKLKFDGAVDPTAALWSGMFLFKTPSQPLGSSHTVTIRNTVKNVESAPATFKVVAPIGYRGYHGWQFKNFGSADLTWSIYRDYFTPSAVEYANGTHKYAAQAWFDATYKHIGNGGCCYGMSIRSIRTRRQEYTGLYGSWWPSNVKQYVWMYPWTDPQIGDSVREDQSGQLCAQSAALINDRWNHQTHIQAATFIWNAISSGDTGKLPIICTWIGGSAGHATVAYNIGWDGAKYSIPLYDNNKPYSETETNDSGSTAYVYANGTFSYTYGPGWTPANKMIALSFNELVYALPLLPTQAGGTTGLASECTVVSFESQSAVRQITDENGKTFFANGQENTNPSTRIPESMRFIPMTGAKWPADAPALFIFNHSAGKSLTFDVAGSAASNVRVFSPKSVTSVSLANGRFSLRNIMRPAQELQLDSPNTMGLQSAELAAIQDDNSERVFQMQGLANVGSGALKLGLSETRDALVVSGAPAQFNLNIKGFSSAGARSAAMQNVAVQSGRATAVTVPSFANLQNSTLRLENR